MTLNLKEIIDTYSDVLRPCPTCGSRRLVVEENITRVTVFNYDDIENTKRYAFAPPTIRHIFKCVSCSTIIYGRTTAIKEEKNYFEVLARIFKEMDYSKTKARLGNTRQATINGSVKND